MPTSCKYRAEAAALARATEDQLCILIMAWDLVDEAVESAQRALKPLRRPEPEPKEAPGG